MTRNVVVDDALIAEAMTLGGHKTRREAAMAALESYIKSKRRVRILDMFGKVDFRTGYGYKIARRRGSKRVPKD